jgi:hypothetical protein
VSATGIVVSSGILRRSKVARTAREQVAVPREHGDAVEVLYAAVGPAGAALSPQASRQRRSRAVGWSGRQKSSAHEQPRRRSPALYPCSSERHAFILMHSSSSPRSKPDSMR